MTIIFFFFLLLILVMFCSIINLRHCFPLSLIHIFCPQVIVQHAYRKDNSVIIQWDSEVSNILGFRVVYRLFGDKNFKVGLQFFSAEVGLFR